MSTTDSPVAPAAEPEHAWFREYEGGWEFLVPGGGALRVPYDATDSDRPLHEQLQRFADGIKIHPDGARPANVIEALARCIAEMPAIGKDKLMGKEGDSQSYHYRSIEAVASHAAMLFGKYCVVPKVHKTKRAVKEYTVKSGGLWTEDHLMVKYRLYGPGGKKDHITTGWFHALGRDNSDKGTNKAMTQAFKQMLVQTLVVGDNKDDPDSYSAESTAAAGQEETRPPTWIELGWRDLADYDRNRNAVIDAIRRLTDNGDLSPDDAKAMWKEYNHPDPEAAPKPRTSDDHMAWWEKNLPGIPRPETAEPEAAQEPEPAQEAQTPPEQPSEAQEPPQGPQNGGETQQPEPSPAPEREYAIPEDNGHRSAADEVLREAGPDELIAYLQKRPLPDVLSELRARGCNVGGEHKPDALRRWLGSIVVRRAATAGTPEPDEPAQSAAKAQSRKPRG